ncbi:NADH dehydrogenase I chain E [Salmonella enterica subsp. enterica]|nr:NADH dehydrogenase I chain E [Salmonella enterica subsp. enterica]
MHENQQPQTEAFELSAAEREAIEHEKHHYEDPRAASIEALKIVQKQRGWVPDGAIYAIADVAGYSGERRRRRRQHSTARFFRQPVGRHVIRYCDSVVCHITGYQGIQAALEKNLNIKPGRRPLMVALRCCRPAAWGIAIKGRT